MVYLSSAIIPSRTANSIHVMKMCQAFAQNGLETLLLAPDDSNVEKGVGDIYQFYGVEKVFSINKLPWIRIRGRGYVYALLSALRSFRFKPGLVYGRFLPGCYFSALLGLPVVLEAHAPAVQAGRLCDWLFTKLCRARNFRGLVVISDALRRYYQERYQIPEADILVAHDAADIPPSTDTRLFTEGNRMNIGYIGHL